ncbi:hypothetical protein BGZ54_006403 [Gamsiella multidivaricata]|nr:hypothetical protein BGZ54_006403 [Gamsiella multidivaricata]
MGILNPVCVATDGTYVYALAYAPSFNDSSSSYNILIKSNANPPYTLDNLSWTLVSAVPRDAYYYLGEDNINGHDYGCLADATGVFTALARSSKSSRDAAADNVSRGLQYQPYGNVWKNVSTSQGYVWNELSSSQLVNIKDPVTGVTAIIHASIASHNSTSAIAVAALNTNTLTMIQNPSMWSLDLNKFGLMQGLAILGNGTMYGIGRNLTSNFMQRAALTAIPISNGSTVAPFEDSLIPISADGLAGACGDDINGLNMLPWGNKIVFTCAQPQPKQCTRVNTTIIFNAKSRKRNG